MSKQIVNRYLAQEFKKLGRSQKEIIEDLNKTQPYVSALMSGKKSVGKEIAIELYNLYGFDPAKILLSELEHINITNEVISNENINEDDLNDSDKIDEMYNFVKKYTKEIEDIKFRVKVLSSISTKAFELLFENFDMEALDTEAIENQVRSELNSEQ
ncbi:helix-turn-helix transcriptional regulator [Chryseobacterium bernardetii]|uniref:helix-turn-helix domain-containing protein n=1 Tax=Chryseobacterium bernardetii TaxID=1241978 RepID=UPI00162A954D|nr:helix-turn-helix transcriptional regulator [Chryseobacterium bernardetii]